LISSALDYLRPPACAGGPPVTINFNCGYRPTAMVTELFCVSPLGTHPVRFPGFAQQATGAAIPGPVSFVVSHLQSFLTRVSRRGESDRPSGLVVVFGFGQPGLAQISLAQIGLAQVGPGRPRSDQRRTNQISLSRRFRRWPNHRSGYTRPVGRDG
jgi:hypothetical protein